MKLRTLSADQTACCRSKESEVQAGVDGFLLFDSSFITAAQQMFAKLVPGENQLEKQNERGATVTAEDLLQIAKVL